MAATDDNSRKATRANAGSPQVSLTAAGGGRGAAQPWARSAALIGGAVASGAAGAATLPEDKAEAMYHLYDGGGVKASGPALLVRKSLADKVSLSASYYLDAVSNASIDVMTTASPFKEKRNAYAVGADYLVRDSLLSISAETSKEPDYKADAVTLGVSQEVFGGMTTVSLGYTRGSDKVGKKDEGFFDYARHWQYRLGVTQILTPRLLASLNFEAVSDDGYLGNPYRAARVFGAAVPERNPRTRSSRAIKASVIGDLGSRNSLRGEYRYFWDTWAIKAHTFDLAYSRWFGDQWLADATLRYYTQDKALFYSDNAATETFYVSRNRQLATYNSVGLGAKLAYTWKKVPGQYEIKLNGAYEFVRFKFKDFTDIRNGSLYSYDASVLQLFVSATF